MSSRTKVSIFASDPVSAAGIASELRTRADILVVEEAELDDETVAIVVADKVDQAAVRRTRAIQRNGCRRVIMVVTSLDDAGLLAAVESGACGILRRYDADADRLAQSVGAAARGDGSVPPDLLGRLLDQMSRLQRQVLSPRGLSLNGLSEREIEVLRLVADGHDTAEIAGVLCYSERTIKNVIHQLTTRLQLRNRTHAVAYAMRQGLI